MNGRDIRNIRDRLGVDQYIFARSIGVHVSTVFRWEQHWNTGVAVDKLREELLAALKNWTDGMEGAQHAWRGQHVGRKLQAITSPLEALRLFLKHI